MVRRSKYDHAEEISDLLIRVYEIHETILTETGGIPGLRDAAMLHSATIPEIANWLNELLNPSKA